MPLGWGDWDPTAWEDVWIYRAHLDGTILAGRRVRLHFEGVMTSATVYLNGTMLAHHDGGYLPWTVELTGGLRLGDNVIAVTVDGSWLDVPPGGNIGGAASIDYLQPAGIYRNVTLHVLPQVCVADVFVKPTNVLTARPGVDVAVTIDAANQLALPLDDSSIAGDGSDATRFTLHVATRTATTGRTPRAMSLWHCPGRRPWWPTIRSRWPSWAGSAAGSSALTPAVRAP